MNVGRLARRNITLSDGTTLPKGALISSAMEAQHHDPRIYGETAEVFDGFRFSNARDTEKESLKHQIVYNNTEFHLFGAGRHAWCVLHHLLSLTLTRYGCTVLGGSSLLMN